MGLDLLSVVVVAPPSAFHHSLKPLVSTTPSYIKDTPHLISLLESTHIPSNAILVTIDVSSLYTNIPQDEGTESCLEAIEAVEASHIPRNLLQHLFDIVLRCNVFSVDSQVYQQIQVGDGDKDGSFVCQSVHGQI